MATKILLQYGKLHRIFMSRDVQVIGDYQLCPHVY